MEFSLRPHPTCSPDATVGAGQENLGALGLDSTQASFLTCQHQLQPEALACFGAAVVVQLVLPPVRTQRSP